VVEETGEIYSELLTLYEISLKCVDKNDKIEMQIIRDFFDIINEVEYNKFIETYEEKLAKILIKEYEKVTSKGNLKDILEIEKEDKYMIRLTEEDRMQERQEGRQEGIQEGIEKGIEKSINIFIETFKELNLGENDIIRNLVNKFKLTPEQARKYLG